MLPPALAMSARDDQDEYPAAPRSETPRHWCDAAMAAPAKTPCEQATEPAMRQ